MKRAVCILALVLLSSCQRQRDLLPSVALGYIAGLASQQVDEVIEFRGFVANSTNGQLIPRITFVKQTGSRLRYDDSATDGLSVTVLRSGIIDVQYMHQPTVGNQMGITRNASVTTALSALTGTEILGANNCTANNYCDINAAAQSADAGDVIRPHNSGVNITPLAVSNVLFRVSLRSR